jgi:membrane associated rhomboid family serine protease
LEAYLRKLTLLFVLCYSAVLTILVSAFILKILSPRGFGIAALVSMVVATAVLTILIQKARTKFLAEPTSQELDPDSRKRLRRRVLWMKAGIAFFVFGLLNVSLVDRSDPPWVRLAAAAFGLLWIALLASAMRKTQKRLA